MKKLISVLILAALLASSCMLTSCFHEHVFGEWKTVTNATCTKEGLKERVCECGEKETQAIPMIDHNYASATCEKPKTCTMCGKTSGASLGHNYSKATCDAPQKCSRCGQTVGSALGHTTDDGVCSRCGKNFGKWEKSGNNIVSTSWFPGKYCHYSTTEGYCTVQVSINSKTGVFDFRIYENGNNLVTASVLHPDFYNIIISGSSGNDFSANNQVMVLGETMRPRDPTDKKAIKMMDFLKEELCKPNNTILIYAVEEEYGFYEYIIFLESSNFKQILDTCK